MAAIVHAGTGNFTYSNNTGGNVRVIVCLVKQKVILDGMEK